MLSLLKELCAVPGPSGYEEAIRACIKEKARPYADEMRVDAMGNLIVFKKGAKTTGNKLMLCAHMDEVGLIIHSITEKGYLKFRFLGGVDRRVTLGKPVWIGEKAVPGVIALKAIHLTTAEERMNIPKLEDLYIDIGATSREEAETLVEVGDFAVFGDECVEFGDRFLKAKAIDDRLGCAVMLKLLEEDLPMDCTFAFTVQEEVGTRGAFGAAFSVTPEIALLFEGTTAADNPTLPEHKQVCWPGKGPVLSLMDGGTIYDKGLFALLRETADKHQIPWQVKHYLAGGTDGQAIQRTKSGVRVAGISAAVRYLHSPSSVASIDDMEHILTLAHHFMDALAAQEGGNGDGTV